MNCRYTLIVVLGCLLHLGLVSSGPTTWMHENSVANSVRTDVSVTTENAISNRLDENTSIEESYKGTNKELCPVCMEELGDNELIITDCSHRFHKDCLLPWTEKNRSRQRTFTCPCCRSPLKLHPSHKKASLPNTGRF